MTVVGGDHKEGGNKPSDIQEDCLPLGTQPKRNRERDLYSRTSDAPCNDSGCACPSDTRSCKTIIKALLPFFGFELVSKAFSQVGQGRQKKTLELC